MGLIKTITDKEEKTIWFCGCEIKMTSTSGYYPWDDKQEHPNHEKRFNKKKMQLEYICHENKVFMVEKYKLMEEKMKGGE